MFKSKPAQLLCVIILIIGWLFYFYHDLILSPNDYLTADWGDGVKAYAVYIGHIKNDSTYTNYQNMNYPYGQTHIYTDGQTGIANTFKFLSHYSSWFIDNAIGLYNLMMIFSYVGCSIFLFLIIKRLNMPPLFAILGSICITVLSPQIFRITGHLTLSYVVFFPLSWWLLIKFTEAKSKILFTSLIVINSVFWFFVHPYYVMIVSLFYASWWFVAVLQNKKLRVKSNLIFFFLHVVIPLIINRLYVSAADTHSFRSESPWGFWSNYARWNTVFMPTHPPFVDVMRKLFFPNGNQEWEGWAYIGMAAVIVTVFSIFKIVRYVVRKKYRLIFKPVLPTILRASVWASVFVLLFSMCLPFQLGLHFLVDWLSVLKQFRSLGRFAWVFYYVFTVYSVYVMYLTYRYFNQKDYRALAFCFPLVFFSLYLIEAKPHHQEVSEATLKGKNYFKYSNLNDDYKQVIEKINAIKNNYQCIVPLPFYHVGTENFGKIFSDNMIRASMVIAHWTNVPLLANSAARAPIIEGKNSMQFFSPTVFCKEIEKDLPNKKPFLVLFNKEELNFREQEWLNKSKTILRNNGFELRELTYDDVFKNNSEQLTNEFDLIKDSLYSFNKFLCSKKPNILLYNGFDDSKSEIAYRGKGAFKGVKRDYNVLLPKGKYNLQNDRDYIVSFWYFNKDELRVQNTCIIEECDSLGNNGQWAITWSPGESMVIDGDWSLVEKKFRLKNNDGQISILLNGDSKSKQEIYVDDFLLRPADVDVYQLNKNSFCKNTIEVKKKGN